MTDRTVRVLLTADAKRLLSVVDSSGAAMQRLGGQASDAGRKASAGLDQVEKSAQRTGTQLQSLGRLAAGAFAGLTLVALSRSALQAADDYTSLTGRVDLYNNSQRATNQTLGQLFRVAQDMRSPFLQISGLYVSLKQRTDDLSASNQDLIRFTSGVAAGLAIDKTASGAAQGALQQLGQVLGGPIVQMADFNSLVDAMPSLLKAASKNLNGTGRSVSKLITMVRDGKLATKDFFEAALKGSDDLVAKATSMQSTVSQSLTRINNSWVDYIGRQNQAQGGTAKLSTLLNELADNMDTVVSAAVDIGAVVVSAIAVRAVGGTVVAIGSQLRYAASIVESRRETLLQAQAELSAAAATTAHTAAMVRQTEAQIGLMVSTRTLAESQAAHAAAQVAEAAAAARVATATRGAALAITGFRTIVAALGGPIGIAITALTALAFWFLSSGDSAEKGAVKATKSIDDIIAKTKQLQAVRSGAVVLSDDDQDDLKSLASELGRVNTAIALYQQMSAKAPGESAFSIEIDRLTGRAQELQSAIAAITSPPTAAPIATPGASASAAAEAELAKLRASLQALSAVQKAAADRQTAALDEELRQNLIGYRDYYTQRGALEAAAVQREIAANQAQIAQLWRMRDAVSAETPTKDNERDEQTKKLSAIDAQRLQLQGEINAAKVQEQTINEHTQSQIAAAADDAEKRLADVRSRLAALTNDAASIAAETRAQLEREYRGALNDPSTSDSGRAAINSLIDRESLQAEFDAVRAQADSLVQDLRQRWDSLSQSVQAGTISTTEAQREFGAELDASNTPLQGFLERLQQLGDKLGPDARREVQGLAQEFGGLTLNVRTPLQQLAAEWSDTTSQMQQVGVSTFNSIADALTNAVMTGKFSWRSLATSIVSDLIRVQIQALLTGAAVKASGIANWIGTIIGVAAGAAGGASTAGAGAASSSGSYVPMYAADGGVVMGPGTETSDSVPARLSNGEFVLRAAAVKSVGVNVLQAINTHGVRALNAILGSSAVPAYASGGVVGASAAALGGLPMNRGSGMTVNVPLSVQVSGDAGNVDQNQLQDFGKQLQGRIRDLAQDEIVKAQRPGGLLASARS